MPLANEFSVASGIVAYALHEPGGWVLRTSAGKVITGGYEPSLSDDGQWLAYRRAGGDLCVLGIGPGLSTIGWCAGPGTRARWSSQTVVWEWAGRVYGRSTPDVATVELTIPGRSCSHPLPLWDGRELWCAMVCDEGELVLGEWTSLVAQEPVGYVIGRSTGPGFDWSAVAS